MDYNSIGLLMYKIRTQPDDASLAKAEKEFETMLSGLQDVDTETLQEIYETNAAYAAKMSAMLEKSAAQLHAQSQLESSAPRKDEILSLSMNTLTDSVVWEDVFNECSALLELIEEEMTVDGDEDTDEE